MHDHNDDELISQRTTVLGNAFGPDDHALSPRGRRTPTARADRAAQRGRLQQRRRLRRQRHGQLRRHGLAVHAAGLQDAHHLRRPEGSTLDDWPISYEDLEPYYEKAEWEIGVSGDASANPFAAPRKKPHPMPAFPFNREGLGG